MFSNSSLLTFYCRQNAKIRKSLIILYFFFKAVYPLSRYFEVIMLFLGAQYIKKHVVAPPYIHSVHPQPWILGHRAAPPQEMEDYIFSRASGQKLLMERMVFLSSFIKVFMALNLNRKFWGHKLAFFFITIISKRFSIDLSVCMNGCCATWSLRSFPCISNHCTVSQSLHQATWSWKWDPICKTVVW